MDVRAQNLKYKQGCSHSQQEEQQNNSESVSNESCVSFSVFVERKKSKTGRNRETEGQGPNMGGGEGI